MKRVLVVEDNPLNRELLRTLLESVGCRVDEAENGADALAMLAQQMPDVVLTDLQMPVMSGSTFLREVRKHPRFSGLKIVAVSAYAMQSDRERALAEGFDDYVTKPIRLADFREQMGRLLASVPHGPGGSS